MKASRAKGPNSSFGSRGVSLFILLSLAAVLALVLSRLPFWSSEEKARNLILATGIWGPLFLIILQALQVFLAPIPGQVIGAAGGYVFGPWLGTLYSMTGVMLGSILAIMLSRRYGRPLVERFVSKETLARMDDLTAKGGLWFLFIAFLLPFFPDDALCFLAGLSSIPFPWLLAVIIVGRLPGVAASALLGAGISRFPPELFAVLFGFAALLIVLHLIFRRF